MDEETSESHYAADLPIYERVEDVLVEKELGDPRLTYVSDCIIISTEPTLDGFKALSRKIHKITADLAYEGYFCRGAITKGKLFHHKRIIFGSAYIRAYELEGELAKYPRIIVDPKILLFFDLSDNKVPLAPAFFGKDADGLYYQRFLTWFLFPPYAVTWPDYLQSVRIHLVDNLVRNTESTRIQEKYIWLKDEFNSLLSWWHGGGLTSVVKTIEDFEWKHTSSNMKES